MKKGLPHVVALFVIDTYKNERQKGGHISIGTVEGMNSKLELHHIISVF